MRGVDPLLGQRFVVCKRDGRVEEFNEARILLALESAFAAHYGVQAEQSLPDSARAEVKRCADRVVERVLSRAVKGEQLEVERIQDAVEEQLMAEGHHEVARRYILYREDRRRARVERESRRKSGGPPPQKPLSLLPSAEEEPGRSDKPTRTWLEGIYEEALPRRRTGESTEDLQRRQFESYLSQGEYLRSIVPELLELDGRRLARGLRVERDELFATEGLEALAGRYLARVNGRIIETPQYFWMKVAMGLALGEKEAQESRALEFYEALSTFRFIASEAILRHTGTPQVRLICGTGEDEPACLWAGVWRADIWHFLARPKSGEVLVGEKAHKGLWVPDLFLQRVKQCGTWTLFDPSETECLRRTCGVEFEANYLRCEQDAAEGKLRLSRRVHAGDLWREILSSLQLTGQPQLAFQDVIAVRSLQGQGGWEAQAWDEQRKERPFGAINLAAHVKGAGEGLDIALLQHTVTSAMRMLDNAVELSAGSANPEYRPVGLGVAGFDEALQRLGLSAGTAAAADFADASMEWVSYFAVLASVCLAAERGSFPRYADSKWSEGVLPIDTVGMLAKQRAVRDRVSATQDWESLRVRVREQGLRNASITAMAPLIGPSLVAGLAASNRKSDPEFVVECAARRQKWIDLDHSLDLAVAEENGGRISHYYMQAWEKGLKTMGRLILMARSPKRAETADAPVEVEGIAEMAPAAG